MTGMAECDPRLNIESCLAELHEALTRLGVTVAASRDHAGRAGLDVHDHRGGLRRVHVYPQLFWFLWGDGHHERHSVFQVADAARIIADTALGPGWPDAPQSDLARILRRYTG